MAFVGETVGQFANWIGEDVIGGLTGAKGTQEALNKQADLSKQQSEEAKLMSAKQQADMMSALGSAQDLQATGHQQSMNYLQPYADQGSQASQQYTNALMGQPSQFNLPESEFRGQMLGLMNQGPSALSQDILNMAQQDAPISQEVQDLMRSPLEVGPLKESRGYNTMRQARGEALDDLATGLGASGLMFSGQRMKGAADISGRMAQDLEREQYGRAASERQQNIANLMGLDREQYGRGQNQLNRLMGLEQQQYGRGQNRLGQMSQLEQQDFANNMRQQTMSYGAQQDWLNRLMSQGQMGQNMALTQAQNAQNYGNLMGNQLLNTQGNIANIAQGGQAQAHQLAQQGGQYNVQGAQARQDAFGDIIGAAGAVIGGI